MILTACTFVHYADRDRLTVTSLALTLARLSSPALVTFVRLRCQTIMVLRERPLCLLRLQKLLLGLLIQIWLSSGGICSGGDLSDRIYLLVQEVLIDEWLLMLMLARKSISFGRDDVLRSDV